MPDSHQCGMSVQAGRVELPNLTLSTSEVYQFPSRLVVGPGDTSRTCIHLLLRQAARQMAYTGLSVVTERGFRLLARERNRTISDISRLEPLDMLRQQSWSLGLL